MPWQRIKYWYRTGRARTLLLLHTEISVSGARLQVGVDKLCFLKNLLFYSILDFLAYYSSLKSHYSFL